MSNPSSPPPPSWSQMVEDRRSSLEQRLSEDQLPAYSEATKHTARPSISEKEPTQKPSKPSKSPSRMATFKSILTGDAHKHNPRLRDPLTQDPRYTAHAQSPPKPPTPSNGPSKSSTFRNILTGDVHKHNPRLRDPTAAQNPRYARAQYFSTIRSVLSGETHQRYHPMYRLEESL
ncbi:hypothetical protein B0A50_06244 [Salinomyces thailandicus]|uniref:Uncharacterized protein n=1 Tax=Salinomyces thailandicus TaxID=706561 RepID=A0A4U0TT20_9PEZI|nr:hypothetical protein B0A50_06244 [Salinomyces thailandica]